MFLYFEIYLYMVCLFVCYTYRSLTLRGNSELRVIRVDTRSRVPLSRVWWRRSSDSRRVRRTASQEDWSQIDHSLPWFIVNSLCRTLTVWYDGPRLLAQRELCGEWRHFVPTPQATGRLQPSIDPWDFLSFILVGSLLFWVRQLLWIIKAISFWLSKLCFLDERSLWPNEESRYCTR